MSTLACMKTVFYVLPALLFALSPLTPLYAGEASSQETRYLWPDRTDSSTEWRKITKREDVHCLTGVTSPSITVYPVSGPAAPAVMVCPGGGYKLLAFDLEGTEIATWLNSIGFAAVVLKYRVPDQRAEALQDAQRAMGMIRCHSREWGIDPDRLGVIGFSAGGHLSARLSNTSDTRTYTPVDEADRFSCRPDFTMLIYPAYLGDDQYNLPEEVSVTENTPAAFIVQAVDDRQYVNSSIAYALALKKQNISMELHLFPSGGHGYGLRPPDQSVSHWPELAERWLKHAVSTSLEKKE